MKESGSSASAMIVAIDGPSGVGKSTVALRIAERLGIPYLSTGEMYRAVALRVLESDIDPSDRPAVEKLAGQMDLELEVVGSRLRVRFDGSPSGHDAYSLEVSEVTSRISTYPLVRRRMVELQREAALRQGAVLEGRDIGTRVFPETPYKFFLEARPEIRAERRWLQLQASGREAGSREDVLRQVLERDERDSNRSESPLTCDQSYCLVDSSDRSVDEVVELIVAQVGLTRSANRGSDD